MTDFFDAVAAKSAEPLADCALCGKQRTQHTPYGNLCGPSCWGRAIWESAHPDIVDMAGIPSETREHTVADLSDASRAELRTLCEAPAPYHIVIHGSPGTGKSASRSTVLPGRDRETFSVKRRRGYY